MRGWGWTDEGKGEGWFDEKGEVKGGDGGTEAKCRMNSWCSQDLQLLLLPVGPFIHPPSSSNQSSEPLWSLWVNRWQRWGVDWRPPHVEKEKLGCKHDETASFLGNTKYSCCRTLGEHTQKKEFFSDKSFFQEHCRKHLYNLHKPNVLIWKTKKRKSQRHKSEVWRYVFLETLETTSPDVFPVPKVKTQHCDHALERL